MKNRDNRKGKSRSTTKNMGQLTVIQYASDNKESRKVSSVQTEALIKGIRLK